MFIKYTENGEKKKVDIGLKLRNSGQKLHIPYDVIYTENYDRFGSLTQFWGFSEKAEEVIIDYLNAFPWLATYVELRAHHEAAFKNAKSVGGDFGPGGTKQSSL